METDPDPPLCTITSPEPVCTSRFTGPLTCKVFSKCPCGVEAAAKMEASSAASPITKSEDRAGIETGMREAFCLFMSEGLHRCHIRGALGWIHARGHGD